MCLFGIEGFFIGAQSAAICLNLHKSMPCAFIS